MPKLDDASIVWFFLAHTLPSDPKEADRLLKRIIEIAEKALVETWNQQ